jgi:hypothetical protein
VFHKRPKREEISKTVCTFSVSTQPLYKSALKFTGSVGRGISAEIALYICTNSTVKKKLEKYLRKC